VGVELSKTLKLLAPDQIPGNWEDFFEANKCLSKEKLQLLTKRTQQTLPEHIKELLRDTLHMKDEMEESTNESNVDKKRKAHRDEDEEGNKLCKNYITF
jgi:hypothetical protein